MYMVLTEQGTGTHRGRAFTWYSLNKVQVHTEVEHVHDTHSARYRYTQRCSNLLDDEQPKTKHDTQH